MQIAKVHASNSNGVNIIDSGSQYQSQTSYGNNAQLLAILSSKQEAQFHNLGSAVGSQVGFNGSSFLNENSQIVQPHTSKGARMIGSGSQYQSLSTTFKLVIWTQEKRSPIHESK